MPNAGGNHHHVAGADFVAFAVLKSSAIDAGAIQVADRRMAGCPPLGIYYCAARDKRPGTLHHVVDLLHLVVLDGRAAVPVLVSWRIRQIVVRVGCD